MEIVLVADNVTSCADFSSNSSTVIFSHKLTTLMDTIVILVAVILNFLGMRIFCSDVMKSYTTAVYLFYLAISDNVYLVSVFLSRTLHGLKCLYIPSGIFDVYNTTATGCKLLQYLVDLFADYSTCLILLLTIERYIACYHPLIYKTKLTTKFARTICLLFILTLSILLLPHHLILVKHYKETQSCDYDREHERLFDYIFMAEVLLLRVLPTFAIGWFNICIIVKLIDRANERLLRTSSLRLSNRSTDSCFTQGGESSGATNLILILISLTYFVCYQPILVFYFLTKLSHKGHLHFDSDSLIVGRNYCRSLYILGYSANFFFYALAGRIFRKQLVKMLKCQRI
jgi:hypothetical protein